MGNANLSVHCELAHYAASCTKKMNIQVKYNPDTKEYAFVKASRPALTKLYKDDTAFFAKMRDELDKMRQSKSSLHHKNKANDVLRVSAWTLEMLYRERNLGPRRPHMPAIERENVRAWAEGNALAILHHSSAPAMFIALRVSILQAIVERFEKLFNRRPDVLVFCPDGTIKTELE